MIKSSIFRLLLSLLISFIPFFLITSKIYSATLFDDNFNDSSITNAKWDTLGSSLWRVNNGEFGVNIYTGVTNAIPQSSYWNSSWQNFIYTVDLRGVSGVDKNILVRFLDNSNFYEIHHNDSGIYFEKTVGGSGYPIAPTPNPYHLLNDGTLYHFKIEKNNNHYKISEGGNVLFDLDDDIAHTFEGGKPGLRVGVGAVSPSEVWYDNVVITDLAGTPTPVPTPIPTPVPTIGPFELPFDYPQRLSEDASQFKSAFWNKIRAVFDHSLQTGIHRPFTGNAYSPSDIATCTAGAGCYDSHNGTDFSGSGDQKVFSVSSGKVIYASSHGSDTCAPESNFGCVVVAKYTGSAYGLFAHLDKIFVNQGSNLDSSTQIGEMGATGCTGCLKHLHFGVLKPVKGIKNSILTVLMSKNDWQGLLKNINSDASYAAQSFCSYTAPNGAQFNFQDPSGWKGSDKDPWSLATKKGGCGITSPYLWRYDIGTTP